MKWWSGGVTKGRSEGELSTPVFRREERKEGRVSEENEGEMKELGFRSHQSGLH